MKKIIFLVAITLLLARCKDDGDGAERHEVKMADLVDTSWKISAYNKSADNSEKLLPAAIQDNVLTLFLNKDKTPAIQGWVYDEGKKPYICSAASANPTATRIPLGAGTWEFYHSRKQLVLAGIHPPSGYLIPFANVPHGLVFAAVITNLEEMMEKGGDTVQSISGTLETFWVPKGGAGDGNCVSAMPELKNEGVKGGTIKLEKVQFIGSKASKEEGNIN